MYIQSKLNAALFFMIFPLLLSCGHIKTAEKNSDCLAEHWCTLTGVLSIKRSAIAAVGVLEVNGGCISIALPKSVLENKRRWDEKSVKVSGVIYPHSSAIGVISYTLNDREVLVGACSNNKILYLEKISLL